MLQLCYYVYIAFCYCLSGNSFQIKKNIKKISDQVKLLIGETHASIQRAKHRNIFVVKRIKIHPNFEGLYNDISLIEVEPPMDFENPLSHNGNRIMPICLPSIKDGDGSKSSLRYNSYQLL